MDIKEYLKLDEWRYNTLENGTILLYEYLNNANPDVIVPNFRTMINHGVNMTFFVNDVPFANKSQINSVDLNYIPFKDNEMTQEFNNCTNLTEVTNINQNVIGMHGTFYNCTKLVNIPVIPNSVINMYETFYRCFNLFNISTIPDNVINMCGTFCNCINLVNAPEIGEGVINASYTFRNCSNLTGDIIIRSNQVNSATNCFIDTSLNKDVYIPFTYHVPETLYAWHATLMATYNSLPYTVYTKTETPTTGVSGQIFYENGVEYPGNIIIVSGSLIMIQNSPLQFHRNSFYDMIDGENTITYNSFINAGYTTDPSNRVNGVLLKDLSII